MKHDCIHVFIAEDRAFACLKTMHPAHTDAMEPKSGSDVLLGSLTILSLHLDL